MVTPPGRGRENRPDGRTIRTRTSAARPYSQDQLAAQVAAGVAEHDAEQHAADDRADRAVQAADHRGGEAEHEDRVHAVRVEERGRGDQHPGQRAEQPGQRPAQGQHPADPDPEQPGHALAERRGPQPQADRRVPEDQGERERRGEHGDRGEHVGRRDPERDRPDLQPGDRERRPGTSGTGRRR